MNQLVVGEMGLSGKWACRGNGLSGKRNSAKRLFGNVGFGEMGVDETAIGEMGGYRLRPLFQGF